MVPIVFLLQTKQNLSLKLLCYRFACSSATHIATYMYIWQFTCSERLNDGCAQSLVFHKSFILSGLVDQCEGLSFVKSLLHASIITTFPRNMQGCTGAITKKGKSKGISGQKGCKWMNDWMN